MVSHELSSYLEEKGIRHIRTAFYNPAANGGAAESVLKEWDQQDQPSPDTATLSRHPACHHWSLPSLPRAGTGASATSG